MRTMKKKVAKYDAKQIESGALDQEGKEIAAQIKIMDGYQTEVQKLAGVNWSKYQNNKASVEKRLADARAKCKADGFKAFKAKYAPTFGRTKLYEILRIAAGKTTREEIRVKERDKKRAQRAADRPGQSNVPDASTAPATDDLAQPVNDNLTGEVSTEDRKAEMARLAGETPAETPPEPETDDDFPETVNDMPEQTPEPTPEEIADAALVAFKEAAWALLDYPKEMEAGRKWFVTDFAKECSKRMAKERKAA